MMFEITFEQPLLLLLLPLAVLPLLPQRKSAIAYPNTHWLPSDPYGQWINRLGIAFGVLCIASLLLALAGPMKAETIVERIGRGAELLVLMDRSASMDTNIRRLPPEPGEKARDTQSKNDVVREALSSLVKFRPNNRYALSLFNVIPLSVAPFTDDEELVLAALEATRIGRGPKQTNMGAALLSAIETYAPRPYTGSRSILLVSDGGARLDEDVREQIRTGLQAHRINLYFIYIQGGFQSPDFDIVGANPADLVEEVALHVFFKSLATEYQVFMADDVESMSEAITLIDKQQNLPLTYSERIPRLDFRNYFYWAAFLFCTLLTGVTALKLVKLR